MEVTYRTWLKKEFVETALRSAGDHSLKVVSCDIRPATSAGDNYTSDMFRITVEVTKGGAIEVTSLVVKATKDTSFFNEVLAIKFYII